MRKIIMFNMVTLDGYFEGKNKWDLAWHQVDHEFDEFSIDQLNQFGGIIFGRVTYEGMASFWQSAEAFENDPIVAHQMNILPKYVFSKTLEKADWKNSSLIRGAAVEELTKLKQQPGKELFLLGSADLASTFIQDDLIDEFRLMLNPIVLGRGRPLFKKNGEPYKLKLINTRTFHNGNVLLFYTPDGLKQSME